MTVKKLTDSDKQEILKLYRETGETTSTLAERYDVSNSTISRFLKSTLPEEEYEELIQQKRAARTFGRDATSDSPLFSEPELDVSAEQPLVEVESSPEIADAKPLVEVKSSPETAAARPLLELEPSPDAEPIPASKRLRKRSSAPSKLEETPATTEVQLQLLDAPSTIPDSSLSPVNEDALREQPKLPQRLDRSVSVVGSSPSSLEEDSGAEASTIAQMLGEDLLDESEELMDLDDEDEDLEDLEEDDLDEDTRIVTRRVSAETLVQVLPLSEATLPRTCYLVIDRASELITRPLRDFGDLGQIPSQEVHQKTLPVFDNHRIARRFSTKRDRVIKVPDSRLLQKTRSQLQAKGITRLLVDGRVYSLSSN